MGAGVFLLPGAIAAQVGPYYPLTYLACAAMCLCIALCFAEMGSMYDSTGGAYLYARDAFGPFVGYMVGWIIWLNGVLGWASVSMGFAALLPGAPGLAGTQLGAELATPSGRWLLALLPLVAGLGLLNFRGVRMGVLANNFFSVAKMGPILIFLVMAACHPFANPWLEHRPLISATTASDDLHAFAAAILLVTYLFSGFEEIPVPAGELRNPQRNVPLALLGVMGMVTLLYLAIHTVAQAVLPNLGQIADAPLAAAANAAMGSKGATLIAIGGLVSLIGVNASMAFTGPRSLWALAQDGLLPPSWSRVHPRYHTPAAAIAVTTALVLLLPASDALSARFAASAPRLAQWLPRFDLNTLVTMSALASVVQYVPTCLAVILCRRRYPERVRGFVIPGGIMVPVLALGACAFLIGMAEHSDQLATLVGIALGLPFYLVGRWKAQQGTVTTENTEEQRACEKPSVPP